uniref:Nudix hydrolase domain-containing protein n=1 Tax=Chaetoceros debilis TaxID=122233 RepID=A0A7S3Q322_9STRA
MNSRSGSHNSLFASDAAAISVVQETHYDTTQNKLLPYESGSHRSAKIIIPQEKESDAGGFDIDMPIEEFMERLVATIAACKTLGKSALWIEVSMTRARFIEAMVHVEGLDLHHISSDNKTINLCIWLAAGVENKIPEYATHQIGVGAIVVNSRDEILCVRELRNNYRPWKLPGGLADLGEQLDTAAKREVMEETGIDCEFENIIGFRHTHGLQFGRSDLYFVCKMVPVENSDSEGNAIIPKPVAQADEIAAAAWVPLTEYKAMVNGVNGGEPHRMMQKMMSLYESGESIQPTVMSSIVPGRGPSYLYHVNGKGEDLL